MESPRKPHITVCVCVCVWREREKRLVMDWSFCIIQSHTSRTTRWYLFFHGSTPLECLNYVLGTVLLKVLEAVRLLNSCCCQSWAVFGTPQSCGEFLAAHVTPSSFRLRWKGGVELHGAPARVTFISPRAASAGRGVAELCRKKVFKLSPSSLTIAYCGKQTDISVFHRTSEMKRLY